jgi:hypothetical protein
MESREKRMEITLIASTTNGTEISVCGDEEESYQEASCCPAQIMAANAASTRMKGEVETEEEGKDYGEDDSRVEENSRGEGE